MGLILKIRTLYITTEKENGRFFLPYEEIAIKKGYHNELSYVNYSNGRCYVSLIEHTKERLINSCWKRFCNKGHFTNNVRIFEVIIHNRVTKQAKQALITIEEKKVWKKEKSPLHWYFEE